MINPHAFDLVTVLQEFRELTYAQQQHALFHLNHQSWASEAIIRNQYGTDTTMQRFGTAVKHCIQLNWPVQSPSTGEEPVQGISNTIEKPAP